MHLHKYTYTCTYTVRQGALNIKMNTTTSRNLSDATVQSGSNLSPSQMRNLKVRHNLGLDCTENKTTEMLTTCV